MPTKLNILAHAEMVPMEASGLIGSESILLALGGGNDALSVRMNLRKTPFGALDLVPGDRVFVTLGIVKIGIAEVPDQLPGLIGGDNLLKGNT